MMVQSGAADVVMAGGVESMSNIEYYTTDMRWGARSGSVRLHDRLERGRERSQPEERFGPISGMIETAENLARDYGITPRGRRRLRRAKPPAGRMRPGRKAASPTRSCRCRCRRRRASRWSFARDEGIRADTSLASLGRMRALMKDGTVTAGNASQQNDAAAACLVVAEDKLAELGLEPMGSLGRLGRGRLRALAHGHRAGAGGAASCSRD